jgi:hypothetical protein
MKLVLVLMPVTAENVEMRAMMVTERAAVRNDSA